MSFGAAKREAITDILQLTFFPLFPFLLVVRGYRDDSLRRHIEFLETQGIAGVSHHNLLFSKTAPEPVHVLEEEDTSFR